MHVIRLQLRDGPATSKRRVFYTPKALSYATVLSTSLRSVVYTIVLSTSLRNDDWTPFDSRYSCYSTVFRRRSVVPYAHHLVVATRRSCQRRGVESYARQRLFATRLFCRRYCVVLYARHPVTAKGLSFRPQSSTVSHHLIFTTRLSCRRRGSTTPRRRQDSRAFRFAIVLSTPLRNVYYTPFGSRYAMVFSTSKRSVACTPKSSR